MASTILTDVKSFLVTFSFDQNIFSRAGPFLNIFAVISARLRFWQLDFKTRTSQKNGKGATKNDLASIRM